MHTHRPSRARAKRPTIRCFGGAVAIPQNEAAHGNVTITDYCSCGAERKTNVNGRHIERGPWRLKNED